MSRDPLTLEAAAPVVDAASAVLKAYDVASIDPKVVIPSYMHAALLLLRKSMTVEPK